jgi:hypothetical protein
MLALLAIPGSFFHLLGQPVQYSWRSLPGIRFIVTQVLSGAACLSVFFKAAGSLLCNKFKELSALSEPP